MPLGEVRNTAAMALKALGFGAGKAPPPGASTVNVQVNVVDREMLEKAREKMRQLSRARDEDEELAPVPPSDR